MKSIVKLLEKIKSASSSELYNKLSEVACWTSVRNALHFLLVGRVLRVEQHKIRGKPHSAKIWYLNKNYNNNLAKILTKRAKKSV